MFGEVMFLNSDEPQAFLKDFSSVIEHSKTSGKDYIFRFFTYIDPLHEEVIHTLQVYEECEGIAPKNYLYISPGSFFSKSYFYVEFLGSEKMREFLSSADVGSLFMTHNVMES